MGSRNIVSGNARVGIQAGSITITGVRVYLTLTVTPWQARP
jgi:hypothetical protein